MSFPRRYRQSQSNLRAGASGLIVNDPVNKLVDQLR